MFLGYVMGGSLGFANWHEVVKESASALIIELFVAVDCGCLCGLVDDATGISMVNRSKKSFKVSRLTRLEGPLFGFSLNTKAISRLCYMALLTDWTPKTRKIYDG